MIQLGEVPLSLGIMLIESVDKFLEHELDVGVHDAAGILEKGVVAMRWVSARLLLMMMRPYQWPLLRPLMLLLAMGRCRMGYRNRDPEGPTCRTHATSAQRGRANERRGSVAGVSTISIASASCERG
jgi:hypothetical protein